MMKKMHLHYSDSIKEFFAFLDAQDSRYVSKTWCTTSSEIKQIVTRYFSDINETFNVIGNSESKESPTNKDILISASNARIFLNKNYKIESAVTVCAGGLSALWSTYLQSLSYKNNLFPQNISPPTYILPSDMVDCTAFSSSLQFHISHASPMYTAKAFSAINILYITLRRLLLPKYNNPENNNYLIAEIDQDSLFSVDILSVGIKYLYNEMKYKLCSFLGLKTILKETISLAIDSGNIMDSTEKELGKKILLRKGSIRLAYNANDTKEMIEWAKILKNYGVEPQLLSQDELYKLSGIRAKITEAGSIWLIQEDGYIEPNLVNILVKAIKDNGCKVITGVVSDVFYNKEQNKIEAILVKNNIDNDAILIKTECLFTSLGIKSNYLFDKNIENVVDNPEINIPGTGYSAYLLVYGNIKNPINSNNSHFTPIKSVTTDDGQKITLIKATCGGAIGTLKFFTDHAINNLFYASHIIFADKRVEIIAAKSCSRALNGLNSEKLLKIMPGFYAAVGFGGKGVTDAAGFAKNYVLPQLVHGLVS